MADRCGFERLDTWIDAVFSYGESRRIPVVVARDGAEIVAVASLGQEFDATLRYSRPLTLGGRDGRPAQREGDEQYFARTARDFERAVIAARKAKMAAYLKRRPAAARA